MALIKCHECGGQISDQAQTCPHCGAPAIAPRRRKRKAAWFDFIIRLLFILAFAVMVWLFLRSNFGKLLSPRSAGQSEQPATNASPP
jgi:predicted nucleic acid-binding Zn ribbon protein